MNKKIDTTALKVGELAKRSGLTVRALHHYDSIDLLKPSARATSGYRLYNRADIARLHQIQALRRFGMSLADIAAILSNPDAPFADIIAQQIAALGRQIEQATTLRDRLSHLQAKLKKGDQPEVNDWLGSLELMSMYDRYFTQEELNRLPFAQLDAAREAEWNALAAQIRALIEQGVPADSQEAQQLSRRWMAMLEQDTAADPSVAARLNMMMGEMQSAQPDIPVNASLKQYLLNAFGAFKLEIYARYLTAEEIAHMRSYIFQNNDNSKRWLSVVTGIHQQMQAGATPADPEVRALAKEWMALSQARFGTNPDTMARVRLAHEKEPLLLSGTWVTKEMLAFVRESAAIASTT